jgi:hypothetical protein
MDEKVFVKWLKGYIKRNTERVGNSKGYIDVKALNYAIKRYLKKGE